VPREGAFPLSFTLDAVGPLVNSVACATAYDAVLAGESGKEIRLETNGLRLLLPRSSALDDLDKEVEAAFQNALGRLSKAGAAITERPVAAFDRQAEYFKAGGYAGAEAYHIHRASEERIGEYDPRVGKRILMGKSLSASDYLALGELRAAYIREIEALAAPFDAIVMPTVPCIAPTIAQTDASDEDYFRWNARILRNNGLINFLDGCAASVPCHEPGRAPVGFMVCGTAGSDRHTLAAAAAIERALSRD
jgi:aspartyl-tRNA(Asn)/glutamyl-tRNA(Gln) amidotransferase subunit A